MKKKVLVYCESKDRFKFYLRFNKALFKKNYELFVITNRLSVFIHAIFLNIKSKLIQKTGSDFDANFFSEIEKIKANLNDFLPKVKLAFVEESSIFVEL
ncbi:MAG: hypothetical protein C0425_01960 [Chlorobiaceae bacterium]|nr:hypothetical protein [Chlorobiaceae bacterium]MBA4309083.1 hypothetical protein [Chlorobiaceae bacterium]